MLKSASSIRARGRTDPSPTRAFVREVLSHSIGEAVFTSYLHHQELVGARWILELRIEDWDDAILKHAREEMRHSELMHREAARLRNRLSPRHARDASQACGAVFEATEEYMNTILEAAQRIVVRASGKFGLSGERKRLANYYLLSLLLERRVMKIYPCVARWASSEPLVQVAQTILGDEKKHLREILHGVRNHLLPYGVDLNAAYRSEECAYGLFMRRFAEALEATAGSAVRRCSRA